MSESELKPEMQETQQAGTVVKLSRPFTWEEKEYTELLLDFEKLSGDEIMSLEADFLELNAGKNFLISLKKEHPTYQAVLAAKAMGVHFNFLKKLPAKDFNKVTVAARNFLSGWD
ncbi:phage tail assembly protein [Paenibacillus sp. SAF-054]|uniref:phage tail assembly protein n=1 Tax=unclassified Paenibacillus TaxID=185978 RepID=UPI003F7CE705